ncbi:MAG: amino acid permease [Candidatus Marinimicrobia bacterium]|nr:amino acid permease [Candidatus Neomarinimicrobiota bacterium]
MSRKDTRQRLSFFDGTYFVIASMVGTGVFTSLGYQLINIKSGFILLMLWFTGGIIALSGVLTYSELGSTFPKSGGEYNILSFAIHPSVGFAAGFISITIGFSAPAVIASLAFGRYFYAAIPIFNPHYISVAVLLILNILHAFSFKWGKIFQSTSTLIKLLLILIFIISGFIIGSNQYISFFPTANNISTLFSSSFAISLIWVSYAYSGWNSSIYIASDIIRPQKNIPLSMFVGTVIVTIIYVLLNFIFLYTTPTDSLIGQVEIGYISGENIFGNTGAKVISLGISFLLFSTISSFVFIGPRILQVMGEDHGLIKIFAKKDKNNIPKNAFLFQITLSLIFIQTSSFEQIVVYTSISLIVITMLAVISLFVLRYNSKELYRPYKVFAYPITPLFFLFSNLWILIYTFQSMPFESILGLFFIIASMLFYFFFNQRYKNIR